MEEQESPSSVENSVITVKEKRILLKIRQLEGKNFGRWSGHEKARYYIFLVMHEPYFLRKGMRRNDKLFKMMSNFITTRSPDQCRSHHQKIEKKFEDVGQIISTLGE